MKLNWGKLIVIGVALILVIGVIVAISNGGGPNKTNNPPGIKVCTIQAEVGIANITISNLNTGGGSITIPAEKLPFSFNFTKGDTIRLKAAVLTGYDFNAWYFTSGDWAGTWDNHNNPPMTIKPEKNVVVLATVLLKSDAQ